MDGLQRQFNDKIDAMLRPEIDWLICQSCQPCEARKVCKTRAVMKIDPDEPAYIELARCNGCSHCVPACMYGAITMKNVNGSVASLG